MENKIFESETTATATCIFCEHMNEIECARCHEWFTERDLKMGLIKECHSWDMEDEWYVCKSCIIARQSERFLKDVRAGKYAYIPLDKRNVK